MTSKLLSRLYASGGDDVLLCTLELSNPAWPEIFRICTGFDDVECGIEDGTIVTFKAVQLAISLPARGTESQTLTFGVDNISGAIDPLTDLARDNLTKTTAIYRQYSMSDLSAPDERRLKMSVKGIVTKAGQAQIQCGYLDLFSLRFTRDRQDDSFSPAMRYVS